MKYTYSYYLDEYEALWIYEEDFLLATIENTTESEAELVFKEIVYELRGVDLDKED